MASSQTDKNTTIIRVYKYGLIPKGPFPEGIQTLLAGGLRYGLKPMATDAILR